MESTALFRLQKLRRLVFAGLSLWFAVLVFATNSLMVGMQSRNTRELPFGVFSDRNGEVYAQDFSYNMIYFKGIRDKFVAHPYRIADQEKLVRQELPESTSGLTHAYSPVAYVLALPLLCVSGFHAYLLYTVLSAIGILLLFYFDLLPRTEHPLQLAGLTACAVSIWVTGAFAVGQSTLITTTLMGALWYLLRQRTISPSWRTDVLLALVFWALCLKPSVAIMPLMLLPGARAWRSCAIGAGLLLVTWTLVASHYGGWWTGLGDYLHLLNHYHNADFTAFMQRGTESVPEQQWSTFLFSLERTLLLIFSLALLVLGWTRPLTGSEQFQGMVWIFLLFSPYLLPSENWILCLLVVEGSFFQSRNLIASCGKLLFLLGIFDLRAGLTFSEQVDFPLKCVLFVWILSEWLQAKLTPELDITERLQPSSPRR